jgi:predicted alpha/beta superfamily hydrolase
MEILKKYQVRGATGTVQRTSFDGRIVDFWAPAQPTPYLLVTHDGQNIFDKRTSTRNRTWELAGTATKVAHEYGVPAPVIIAIFHSGSPQDAYGRGKDLAPQDVFTDGVEPVVNYSGIWPTPTPTYPLSELRGNQYLDEIVHSTIPSICAFVGHDLAPAQTALLGASMGGLASLYGMARYPNTFRTALSFSPHWTVGREPLVERLMSALPPAGQNKIWMSRGTKSHDANYGPFQELANNYAVASGYRYGHDLATPIFNRTTHNERSWSSYVNQALRFWLNQSN